MRTSNGIALAFGAALGLGALLATAPVEAAKPPVGRTYFVVSLGMATDDAESYRLGAGCLVFTRDLMCDEGGAGDCGVWWLESDAIQTRKQKAIGFRFDLIDDETGMLIELEGKGRIDSRGPRSSMAGVARAMEPTTGVKINVALAGRAVGAARCAQLVEEFEERND